jgi:hypothetical protein
MIFFISVNCKGESNPFIPVVGSSSRIEMEAFVTKFNQKQINNGLTDTDDMALVGVIHIDEPKIEQYVSPFRYWIIDESIVEV